MTPWVDYSALSTPVQPSPVPQPTVPDTDTYTVKKGDTLGSIAIKYGMSLTDLKALNPQIKNPSLIYPGQKINLKKNFDNAKIYYTVKSGDTATGIAQKYGMTLTSLKRLNPDKKKWDLIRVGEKIRIR